MQNLPIPAAALPPQVNAAPGTLDTVPASGPDSEAFSAVLARELTAKKAEPGPDKVLPGAALSDGQPPLAGGEIMPLQITAKPGPLAPAVLALIPGMPPAQYATGEQRVIPLQTPGQRMVELASSDQFSRNQPINPAIALGQRMAGLAPSDRVSGRTPLIPAKDLPAATSTETSAQGDFPPAALAPGPALDPDNTADFAASGKFLPPVVAAERTSRFGTETQTPQRLPEAEPLLQAAPLLQMSNLSIASASPAASASASATQNLKLDIPIGAPGWNGELAQKVVWMATQNQQVAELRLNPPHLGPVEVMLTLGNDQGAQASIQFASPHLATREAIESALPRLREMLADGGIALGNVTVGAHSFQQQAEAGRQDHALVKQPVDITQTSAGLAGRPTLTLIRGGRNGLVDTFA